jgi:hypothetical protein
MRLYAYAEPKYIDGQITDDVKVITDLGILIDEWESYSQVARLRNQDVTVLDCVEDWVIDHYAWDITYQMEYTMT